MGNQYNDEILILIQSGKTLPAIEQMIENCEHNVDKKTLQALLSRYTRIKAQLNRGTISTTNANLEENRIVESLIEILEHPGSKVSEGESIQWERARNKLNSINKLTLIAIFGLLGLIFYSSQDRNSSPQQLSIYITDEYGNIVLEHVGEINVIIGDRPMRETIGENGRTNFGDILAKYLGDTIRIGFSAEGWELVTKTNRFVFDGKPIYLEVRRDDNLGKIRGIVKSRDGQNFIDKAKILINTDTVIFTNQMGVFNVLLPLEMRISDVSHGYKLTVSKEGYKTTTDYFYPNSTDVEIRLKKN